MNARTMRQLRQIHLWFGMLFAPAILFFAFSGMLQTFDFQETVKGVAPPRWIAVIAGIHKKQDFPKPRKPRPEGAAATPAAGKPDSPASAVAPAPAHSPWPLKVFVGLMSIGLMLSTLLGITIAVTNRTSRRLSVILLATGAVLPVAMLFV
ncbi:hypothetical protein [Sphingomonas sp. 28-63-12]|uniref:hypothetical protein n=1 Tax=Sphingomonas sp. 28-63-12 TaxID=1970434 RepID=UPI000BC66EF6|nr:MAG: hypothetical protein B7Y47_00510 [Sphingomonas sp. 28-63-12]